MIKRPAFLVIPVIIMGIAVVYSLNMLMPGLGSFVTVTGLLLLVATPFSLLHRREVGLHPALNVLLGFLVFVCTQTCFEQVVLAAFAVHGTPSFEWGCNAFGAVQLSLYFGVHAFLCDTQTDFLSFGSALLLSGPGSRTTMAVVSNCCLNQGNSVLNYVLAFAFAYLATSFIPSGVAYAVYESDGLAGCTPAQNRNRTVVIGVVLPVLIAVLAWHLLGVPALCGALLAVAIMWWRLFF